MLEFDWLEFFIHHVMEKKIQETRPPQRRNYFFIDWPTVTLLTIDNWVI